MKQTFYERIGESVYREVLPNGLQICVVPKPEHATKYAFFATRYGGLAPHLRPDAQGPATPAGPPPPPARVAVLSPSVAACAAPPRSTEGDLFFRVSFRLLRLPLMRELSAKPTEGETSERIFFQTAPPGASQYSLPPSRLAPCHLPHQREAYF